MSNVNTLFEILDASDSDDLNLENVLTQASPDVIIEDCCCCCCCA